MQVILIMFRADGERRSFSLPKDVTVIGRREDCDLRIPLAEVSRKHCRFVLDGEELRVEDMGSSNGTYVNGQRVTNTGVQPGDTVQVGPCVFIVQIDGVPSDEEIQPAPAEAAAPNDDTGTPLARASAVEDEDEMPRAKRDEEDDMLDFVLEEVQEERKKRQA